MVDEKKLTRGDLDRAMMALDPEDRIRVQRMVAGAVERMQQNPSKVMFGEGSGLELLAKLGMFLLNNNIDKI